MDCESYDTIMAAAAPSLSLEEIVLKMYDVEGLKLGTFTMRTGEITPVYIDMRMIWSYPDLVTAVSEHIWEEIKKQNLQYEHICGLPYQGIPLAGYLSTKYNIPMILKRQKTKEYGTKKVLEGHFQKDDRIVLVDDVVMTGGTLVDDIPVLQNEGLDVAAAFAFFDRDQGGVERTKHIHGINTFCVMTLPQAFDILVKHGKINQTTVDETLTYLRTHRFDTSEYGVVQDENGAHT